MIKKPYTLGIVGVRGYVGRELLGLLANHESIIVDWVSSRQLEGESLATLVEADTNFQFAGISDAHYFNETQIENLSPETVAAKGTDIIVLALPNGLAKPFVQAIEQAGTSKVIIDLSADYRFDNSWVYSVPELLRDDALKRNDTSLIKISNPGCYATAMQIALAPLVKQTKGHKHIKGQVHCFGISGYSGAGTTPSPNNDPDRLKDNILPYALLEHLHEKEVSYQLGIPLTFSPNVAAFFRGISMITQVELTKQWTQNEVSKLYNEFYKNKAFVEVVDDIPNIQQVVNTDKCLVGGFKVSEDGKRLSLVSCLDNLLKGAASQALQNIEFALERIQ